jgi:hypothetical protein
VTTPLASLRALTRILVALLAINAAWAVWDISLLVREISLLERIDLGGLVSFAEGTALEEQILASTNGFGLLFVASVVVGCMWQFRGQRNLTLAGRPSLRFTPGWAVGWWFIPIANLWKPFQAVRELWSRSDPDERSYVVRGWWVLGLWWATWLISNFTFWYDGGTTSVRDDIVVDQVAIVGNVATIASAVLAIVIVRAVAGRQARLQAWRSPAPARPDVEGPAGVPAPPV